MKKPQKTSPPQSGTNDNIERTDKFAPRAIDDDTPGEDSYFPIEQFYED